LDIKRYFVLIIIMMVTGLLTVNAENVPPVPPRAPARMPSRMPARIPPAGMPSRNSQQLTTQPSAVSKPSNLPKTSVKTTTQNKDIVVIPDSKTPPDANIVESFDFSNVDVITLVKQISRLTGKKIHS